MRPLGIFLLLLSGCGAGLLPTQTTPATAPAAAVFTIAAFDPPPGSVVAGGGIVNITFSENQLNDATVNVVTHFNLVCGGTTLTAAGVVYSTGSSIATVTLPSTAGLASGTGCNLVVSANLRNLGGLHLGGQRYATYTLQ